MKALSVCYLMAAGTWPTYPDCQRIPFSLLFSFQVWYLVQRSLFIRVFFQGSVTLRKPYKPQWYSEFNGYSLQEFVFLLSKLSPILCRFLSINHSAVFFISEYHNTNINIEDGREHDLIHYTVCSGSVCECLHCEGMYSTCIRWQHIKHRMI